MTTRTATGTGRSSLVSIRGIGLAALAGAGWVLALAAIAAGLGALYLLRDSQLLNFGPTINGALPLQQLAGGDSQPLARMVAAWLPAGIAAGVALAATTRIKAPLRLGLLGLLTAVLLLGSGAVADAAAISDSVGKHIAPQLGRSGPWTALVLVVAGAALAPRLVGSGSLREKHLPENPPAP
jgi:hypothetical protein